MQRTKVLLRLTLLILLPAIFLGGCASKKHLKTALRYDEAGLFEDAAQSYMRSLSANRDNIDAKLGLRRTGQQVLEQRLSDFQSHYSNQRYRDAVYAYLEAERFQERARALGVRLDFSGNHQQAYHEVRSKYLNQLYNEGLRQLDAEAFSTAEQHFAEILDIDAAYKDVQALWTTARYEPRYREALSFMDSRLYRRAFVAFNNILSENGPYKNAVEMREQALEGATITLAVLPFYAPRGASEQAAAATLRTNTLSEIAALPLPFYKVVNDPLLNNLPQISVINDPSIVLALLKSAGLRLSADHILMARIVDYKVQNGKPLRTKKNAWLKETREVTTNGRKETVTAYKKTTYMEISQQSSAVLRVEFSLLNLNTGMLVLTDYLEFSDQGTLHYAESSAPYKQLVPGSWTDAERDLESDKIFDNSSAVAELHQLFTSKREFLTGPALMSNLLGAAGLQIARRMEAYNPEY